MFVDFPFDISQTSAGHGIKSSPVWFLTQMQVWVVSLHINIQHAFNHNWRISHDPCNRKSCKARWRLSVPRCWGFAWKRRVRRRKCGNLFRNHGPEWSDLLLSYNIKGNMKKDLLVVFYTYNPQKSILSHQTKILSGLNFSSFWRGAAHGLHSLHLEEIRYILPLHCNAFFPINGSVRSSFSAQWALPMRH